MADLFDLNVTIRRVVAARVSDPSTIEDLTQETFVKVAAVERRLDGDALLAYAIVTARNLTISHARTRAVHDRNAHRLVDYTGVDGPETLTLQRDETDALAAALATLDPDARDLLLRHEVDGVTTSQLADEHDTSSGGIAMRLARARATLRVEFLLAFRRIKLPTARCRPILLALSAGDQRRQHALDAAPHLVTCAVCADLVEPVTQRRRAIAVWIIGPIAELVRVIRTRRSFQVSLAAAIVAVAVTAVAVNTTQRTTPGPQVAVAATSTRTETASPDVTTPVVTTADQIQQTPDTPAPSNPTAPAATSASCPSNPLEDTVSVIAGCSVPPAVLTVTELTGDESFSAVTTTGTDVWVNLTGTGESPITIQPGDTITFDTATTANNDTSVTYGTPPADTDLVVIVVAYADIHNA